MLRDFNDLQFFIALEPWAETTAVVGGRERLQMSGKQPSGECAVGRYGNTKLATGAQHLALQAPLEMGVLNLQIHDRIRRSRSPNRIGVDIDIPMCLM
jgi:hypothetical protein